MSTIEPTKGPWWSDGTGKIRGAVKHVANLALARIVCYCESKADEEFIIRACNTHEATIRAMQLAQEYTAKGQPENANGILVAAIARAEGKTI